MRVESKAQLKSLRMSPRKVRLVVDLIKGLEVDKALAQLTFSKKDAARPVKKLLESAIANAIHNKSMKRDGLMVANGFVDEGRAIKRWQPRAFGRANPFKKRSSHVTLVLSGMIDAQALSKKTEQAKEEKAKVEEKTAVENKSVENKKDALPTNAN